MTTWPHDHMITWPHDHQSPDISPQMINNAKACKEIICQNYKSLKIAFQAGCINKFMSTLYFNTQSVHCYTQSVHCWGYLLVSVFTLIMSVLVEHPEISSRYSPIHHWEMFELIQTKTPPTLMVMITTSNTQHPLHWNKNFQFVPRRSLWSKRAERRRLSMKIFKI